MDKSDLKKAHLSSSNHRELVEASELCGCFFCLKVFASSEVKNWVPKRTQSEDTAFCPHCNIDAVIPSAAGYPLTPEFLQEMNQYWFVAEDEDEK